MALSAGTRLGPYEVLALIGSGGMGEVYKAQDTRLDRTVAIKVLPPQLTDPEHRARFEREAKTIASLSHPHICSLYDVGEHASSLFLVMEHLAGETLAERLRKGALPTGQALEIAAQIAEALSVAHRAGIIHRDLKPGNVMLTKAGVKLLDFGLAKLRREAVHVAAASATTRVRQSEPLTRHGTILGTLQYMAPEQLQGKEVDARTDIWAVGVVLYEMVASRRAFDGESAASIIAAILERDPEPLAGLAENVALSLSPIINRCLAKSLDDRWQNAADLTWALKHVRTTPPSRGKTRRHRAAWLIASGLMATLAGISAWQLRWREPATQAHPARFIIQPPEGVTLTTAGGVAISPDGKRVAFIGIRDGKEQLVVRSIDELDAMAIPGTEGAQFPFFSPDGEWIGFFANQALNKVSMRGGTPVVLCVAGYRRGASWVSPETIVFASDLDPAILQVPASGGTPKRVTQPEAGDRSHGWPEMLPRGNAVLFTIEPVDADGRMKVAAVSLSSGEQKVLLDGASPRFVPPRHLLFARDGWLWGVGFDPERLSTTTDAVRLEDKVAVYGGGLLEYGVAHDGTLSHVLAPGIDSGELTWVDGAGRTLSVGLARRAQAFSLSPDGRRVVLQSDGDVWVYELDRGTLSRLTFGGGTRPSWSPDGRDVLFVKDQVLYTVPAVGNKNARRISPEGWRCVNGEWLVDGTGVVLVRQEGSSAYDIWLQPLSGSARPLVTTPASERQPAPSPDGRWLAYVSDETGTKEVYVRDNRTGIRYHVSTGNAIYPRWARDGRQLFYRSAPSQVGSGLQLLGGELMTVTVHAGPSAPSFIKPRALFSTPRLRGDFDVHPDGRFLAISVPDRWRGIAVVLNWFEELKAKVPAK